MASDRPIRVGVADDHPIAREGLVRLIESTNDLVMVGEVQDGESALELADSATTEPDVLLVDVRLPGIDGFETTRRLRETHSDVDVVILTAFDEPRWVSEAVQAGAKGYMLKTAGGEEILETVRLVARGHMVFHSSVSDVLATEKGASQGEGNVKASRLSPREQEILLLLSKGLTNRDISTQLHISGQTVKTHVERLFKRLGVSTRGEAIATALRKGMIE
jgi:two-component system, NarL family, nitrate/nitrite response regulator NarL